MRFKGLFLIGFLLTIAIAPAFGQYEGGNNDGSSVAGACVTTLDGVDQFSFGTLTGSSTFCDFSSESYTIALNNPPQDIQFYWTVPGGATILAGNFTPSINVQFGNTPGTVSVTVVTACSSTTFNMPVTNGVCTMYQGSSNDGASTDNSCSITLNGAPLLNIAAGIAGSVDFCQGATESYSMQVDNAPSDTYYLWTVPAGSVVTSGQGTSVIIVTFAGTAGNVSVDIMIDCGTTTRTLPVSPSNCVFYAGGDNDGFSLGNSCATDLNGGPTFSVVGIAGSSTFCDFGTEGFSAVTVNVPAHTYYTWTVPSDATIITGQGTANITVQFGNTNGSIIVDVITDCATITPAPFPVSATSCSFYAGGDNDGFSNTLRCATKLDGTNALVAGPIVGSTTFCDFATESYTLTVQGVNPETTFTWSVPAGATIVSGQGTVTILVSFSNNSGNVSVDVSNQCQTVNVSLPVATTNCIFYAGGDNDGFSVIQQCASSLNGGSVFIPGPIVGPPASCNFSTESYSITVAGALANTIYNWTAPAGASIISGQGTATVLVAFANNSGNVAVAISNECETQNVSLPISIANCIFYAGGDNDGFSVVQQCASNLNGGSVFIPGPIVGPAASCNFSTESYTITVAGSLPTTIYNWSVPAGASIISGQGTTTLLVAFGNTGGNVSVAISNECETQNVSLPVSVANCIFYSGGNNDGFSQAYICVGSLSGGSGFAPGPITGPAAFCNFSTDSYSIVVAGANATTTYSWSVPAGASIVSGQGTTTILVSFGNTSGNVAVAVANECETINVTLPVTGSSCIFYAGGNNDGFSVTTVSNVPLPIALVSFDASVNNGIVFLNWETSSELENDFFLVERSKDGTTFEPLTKVDGAGTSHGHLKYQARDTNPYHGTSYYRLSQTDFDGSTAYFRVLVVKIETFAEITKLYPNPVEKDALLHVDYFAEEDGKVRISVVDPAGISSESQMIDVKAGINLFEFTPHFQAAGVHVIIIRSKEKAQALRLVVL